jgi:hypothetical protein
VTVTPDVRLGKDRNINSAKPAGIAPQGHGGKPRPAARLVGGGSASVTGAICEGTRDSSPQQIASDLRADSLQRTVATRRHPENVRDPSAAAVWEVSDVVEARQGAMMMRFQAANQGQSLPKGCVMKTVADDCWQIAAHCEHWAEESQDEATRLAFRQIAKALAGLAFSEEFGPTERSVSEDLDDASLSEHTPQSPSFDMPLAEHEEADLERDVDAEIDTEHRAPTQRLSLPSRTPFPKR